MVFYLNITYYLFNYDLNENWIIQIIERVELLKE